jgi:hypothetical protein
MKTDKGTHAEAEAGDERKGAATPDGNQRHVKRPTFGTDLCGYNLFISASPKSERADRDETFEDGTRATSRHVS